MASRARALVLFAGSGMNRTLSYQRGWPRAFRAHPRFDVTLVNVDDRRQRRLLTLRARVSRFDVVVVLHSVFSNDCHLAGRVLDSLRRMRAPKVYFIGNEYKLMPEKMAFAEALDVSLLVSQLHDPSAHELYRTRLGCAVVEVPSAGLDADIFYPERPRSDRPIDVGYRAFENAWYLGHIERREIAERVLAAAPRLGLRADISLDAADRLDEQGWSSFLNGCKAQLGTEAGGDYFELTDATRNAVNAYEIAHPHATFEEVHDRFFRDYRDPVPGRAVSGRISESAATKTVQVLLEGEYSGYFLPDVHYIPLRKDFANLDEALGRLGDESLVRQLTENAYEVAMSELRYDALIDRFRAALDEVL